MLLAKQVKDIVFVIQSFLDKVANTAGNLDAMLDEDYSKGRKEQTKTRIVYSAFPPDGTEVSGLRIRKVFYGRGRSFCEPELFNSNMVIQLYNESASLRTNEITEKIQLYEHKYGCLRFWVDEDYRLKQLQLVQFSGINEKGVPIIKSRDIVFSC